MTVCNTSFVRCCYRRAFEAQDFPEAEQQCLAALAVDPLHQKVNKELQLQLCRVQQMLNKPQEAVEVST
jgi:two-component SAPR family response regulator